MVKANPLQASVNAGEFGARMDARVDFDKYPNGCAVLKNLIPLPQGGALRAPGSRFVVTTKTQSLRGRLMDFQFSDEQAYPIEAGNNYFRFFRNQGQISVEDTDTAFTNGTFASNITGWTDQSTGGASISWNSSGYMNLVGASGQTSIAEQSLTIAAGNFDQEHVFQIEVKGVAGDSVTVRIGTTSGGTDVLEDTVLEVGTHTVAFTPDYSPVLFQVRSTAVKTVGVDNLVFLSDQALELVTPFSTSELYQIRRSQNADVMYMAHGDHHTRKLSRLSHTAWSLTEVDWEDGPYLDQNTTSTTLTPSATTGLGITITASAVTGINDGDGFTSTDVGRLVRIQDTASTDYGYAVITAITSTLIVVADVKRNFNAANADTTWQLGAWSDTTGYPEVVEFFEQRLVAAATTKQPQTLWFSQSADVENMRPDSFVSSAITVEDDDALNYTIAARRVQKIRWLVPGKNLFIGTFSGEWVVRSDGPIVTPDDIDIKRETTHGSADVEPAQVSNAVLFLQRAERKVRELAFVFEQDAFRAPDLTVLAHHITKGGIDEMAYAEEPHSILWCGRSDGVLLGLVWNRDQNVVGWFRRVLGGSFGTGDAVVESVTVIPGNTTGNSEERDEVWLMVKRTILGQTKRYIEFFESDFEGPSRADYDSDSEYEAAVLAAQVDAFYVDSGLSYSGAATTSVTGLDHLNGQTVKILADGAVHADKPVAPGGTVMLDRSATTVIVGLPYQWRYKSLKLAAGARAGTAVGKRKRVNQVTLGLLHTAEGFEIGRDEDTLVPIVLREVADPMDTAVPLFTGEHVETFTAQHRTDPRIVMQGDGPGPFTMTFIAPEINTRDVV